MHSHWHSLGLDEPTDDPIVIKRAYARLLKLTRPDDDPVAYQDLREAYDWAMGYARWHHAQAEQQDSPAEEDTTARPAVSPDSDAPDTATQTTAALSNADDMHDTAAMPMQCDDGLGSTYSSAAAVVADHAAEPPTEAPPEAPLDYIPPDRLAGDLFQYWQQEGDAALVDAIPAVRGRLDQLPLALRGEASVWIAEFVLQNKTVPATFMQEMADYFHWTQDFRADALLGAERALALRERLDAAHALPVRDPAVFERVATLRKLNHVAVHWGNLWAVVVAFLHLPVLRMLMANTPVNVLQALGLDAKARERIYQHIRNASHARLCLGGALIGLSLYLRDPVPYPMALIVGIFIMFGGTTMAVPLVPLLMRTGQSLRQLGLLAKPWLRQGLPVVLPLILIVWVQFGGSDLLNRSGQWLVPVAAVMLFLSFVIALQAGESSDPVDALIGLPVWLLLATWTQTLASKPEDIVALCAVGTLWANIAMMIWLTRRAAVDAIYLDPWERFRPKTAFGWLWAVVFFKATIALTVIGIVLALPLTLRVHTERYGDSALTSILLAVGFSLGEGTGALVPWVLGLCFVLPQVQRMADAAALQLLKRVPSQAIP